VCTVPEGDDEQHQRHDVVVDVLVAPGVVVVSQEGLRRLTGAVDELDLGVIVVELGEEQPLQRVVEGVQVVHELYAKKVHF
jgi:hypothetical protein